MIANTKKIPHPTISIITATYNAANHIQELIDSLKQQTDKNFEWVIADGGSSDDTVEILKNASSEFNIVISSQPDFGIYDAMNRAIRQATGEYYVVIGSDDYFYPNAIENFKREIALTHADIIVAGVDTENGQLKIHEGKSWLYAAKAYTTAHSVGTLIRRSLHENFGLYSKKLSITADALFIKQVCQAGVNRHIASFTAGFFSINGTSNTNVIHTLIDGLHVQLLTEKNKKLQLLLFIARMLKHIKKLKKL